MALEEMEKVYATLEHIEERLESPERGNTHVVAECLLILVRTMKTQLAEDIAIERGG